MLLIFTTALLIIILSGQVFSEEKTYTVMGESMAPALKRGDRVIVESQAEPLKKGDLVAIKFKNSTSPIVKRIIAVEGDRLEIRKGTILLNGKPVRSIDAKRWQSTVNQLEHYKWVVPPDNIFVLGDNPRNSRDSRRLGLISTSQVTGKVVKVIKFKPR